MQKYDRLTAIVCLVVGLIFALSSYKFGLGKLQKPGPGFIFLVTGASLSFLSLILFIKTHFVENKDNENLENPWPGLKKIIILLGGVSIYIGLLKYTGFFLSNYLLLIFLFEFDRSMGRKKIIFLSLAISIIFYVIFVFLFKLPVPMGFLT